MADYRQDERMTSINRALEMSERKLNPHQRRFAEYNALLMEVSRHALPWVCVDPPNIEKLLSLHSADLLVAQFDQPTVAADGSKQIARAIVKAMTAEGRATVLKLAKGDTRESPIPSWSLAATDTQ